MRSGYMAKVPLVKIEPLRPDEWMDRAACAGMRNSFISPRICEACPVQVECAHLYHEMNDMLDNGTRRAQQMDGTWAGVDHTARLQAERDARIQAGYDRQRKNHGSCDVPSCERQAEVKQLCHMHYTRSKRAGEDGISRDEFLYVLDGEYKRPQTNQFTAGNQAARKHT